MKIYTDKELKKIFNDINAGVIYTGIKNNYSIGRICAANNTFIRWQHYGQSATKNTLENLRFIIEVIFKDCDLITPAIYSKYLLNYEPINKNFKAIDFSFIHPNIYGL